MKQLILFFMLASLAFASCKKSSDKAPEPLVSRVTANGGIAYKFYYNSKRQLERWELFSYETLGNPMAAQFEFSYGNDGLLTQIATYKEPGKVPQQRLVFQIDAAKGRYSGFEGYNPQGPNPAVPERWAKFNYGASGRLNTVVIRDDDDELLVQFNLSYFEDGSLKQRDAYDETITNQLRLTERVIYSLPLPGTAKGWEGILAIPLDGDEVARTVRYDGIQRYTYNNGVLTFHKNEIVSAREYNSDGTLKRHAFTRKNVVPAHPDHEANWEFEYIKE